jgi:hypothetical protein
MGREARSGAVGRGMEQERGRWEGNGMGNWVVLAGGGEGKGEQRRRRRRAWHAPELQGTQGDGRLSKASLARQRPGRAGPGSGHGPGGPGLVDRPFGVLWPVQLGCASSSSSRTPVLFCEDHSHACRARKKGCIPKTDFIYGVYRFQGLQCKALVDILLVLGAVTVWDMPCWCWVQ